MKLWWILGLTLLDIPLLIKLFIYFIYLKNIHLETITQI